MMRPTCVLNRSNRIKPELTGHPRACAGLPLPAVALAGIMLEVAVAPTAAIAQASAPLISISTSSAGAASASPGIAQNLAEVIVTAQRRRQNLQDVPASVAAISGAQLADRNVVAINDLSALVSNLQISNPYGAGSPPTITIRGISSTDFSLNQSRPIAVYLDEGIRQLPSFEAVPLFDIDHIDVLRGPQGTLYGKNATGGAVNIVSTTPSFDTSGYIRAGYGNYNRRESEGAVQTPIISDKLALRLAYTYIENDGVIRNFFPGAKNVEQADVFGFRGTLLAKPSDAVEVVLRYIHSSSGGRNAGVYAADVDFAAAGFPQLATVPGASRQGLGFFESDQNFTGHRAIATDGANAQVTWKISDAFRLASVTTFDKGKWTETEDTDGLAINQERDTDQSTAEQQFVEELRLTGDFSRLRTLAGLFYSHDKARVGYQYNLYFDPACGPACSSSALGGLDDGGLGYVETNSYMQRRDSYSGYGRIEYDLAHRLTLSGGLRWSRDRVAVTNYQAYYGDIETPLSVQTIAPTDLAKVFSNVSGEAVINWKAYDDVNAYASFKQGYRTGAINSQAFGSPSEISAAPPETANSWEVGVKTQPLKGMITFNVATFYTLYHNQQVTSSEVLNGTVIYPLRSVDRSRIYGAESDVTFRPWRPLTLAASLGYTDATYTSGVVGGESVAGNQITNSAKWSGNVSADWRVAEIGDGTIIIRADGSFQSKAYFDVHDTQALADGGHFVGNASVSFEKPKWSFTAWTNNIFEAHYFTYGIDVASEGFIYRIRGIPREFGGRIGYRF